MATRIEVLPIGDVLARVREAVTEPMAITVTASPSRGMEPTIEIAAALSALGHHAIPHVSARLVRDEDHLETIVNRLRSAGITEIFVVGGDAEVPVGEFAAGAQLLAALDRLGHDLRVGIPGYPEGHPLIPANLLESALAEKLPRADLIVTQMCFDADAVHAWVRDLRRRGVELPVYAGLPGPINPMKLLRISAKVGVGESLRVLQAHRGGARLASPKPWNPTVLAGELMKETESLAGLHLYSFNDVAASYRWLAESEFR